MSTLGSYPGPYIDRELLPESDLDAGLLTDRDGRFRIEGLVPGLKYGGDGSDTAKEIGYLGRLFRDVTVAAGAITDLGDLKAVRDNKEAQ